MKQIWQNMTGARRAGFLLVLLGTGALIVGNPGESASISIDPQELAEIVHREVDHISPDELADWIIQGKKDYRLIDLRPESEYTLYHIPGAECVPITGLASAGLLRNEKIVLYSEGGIHSAQAWFLLRARGYRGVYLLRGGLDAWKDEVLFPALPPGASPADELAFEKRKKVSMFFGGIPQTGTTDEPATPAFIMPKMQSPSGPPATPSAGKPKNKKKEGC